ncbi:glycosyltransferase [Pseudomonas sp. phDV1]|nr:glycosyltransferase [Pseudomonas sp. phDV1]AXO61385.1 glycosyltransferase [Pseudomonas sp. phDV1]
MKILTVVLNLDKGGTQRAAQNFAEAYCLLDHDSRILSLYGLGSRYEEVKLKCKVYDGIGTINKIQDWDPDLIHIHSHGPKYEDVLLLIEKCKKAKIIETNVFSVPSPWASFVDTSFQLSCWANWIFNLRGGSKYKSAIVPYPVKTESFANIDKLECRELFCEKYDIDKSSKLLGRIGQAFDGKWSVGLIEVFNKLKKEDDSYHLVVVNPPKSVLLAIDYSPYKKSITVIDKIIGDENLQLAYSAFDLTVVIVEQGESFGMVIPESILCGTPVVTLSTPWADNSQLEVVGLDQKEFLCKNLKEVEISIVNYFNKPIHVRKEIQKIGVRHIKNSYDYIEVAKLALASDFEEVSFSGCKFNSINKLLNYDFFTRFLIKLNSENARKLTIYTTGYKPLYLFPIQAIRFLFRRIVK